MLSRYFTVADLDLHRSSIQYTFRLLGTATGDHHKSGQHILVVNTNSSHGVAVVFELLLSSAAAIGYDLQNCHATWPPPHGYPRVLFHHSSNHGICVNLERKLSAVPTKDRHLC